MIDVVVYVVNEDYVEMVGDFIRLGFLVFGIDVMFIVLVLEVIW